MTVERALPWCILYVAASIYQHLGGNLQDLWPMVAAMFLIWIVELWTGLGPTKDK